MKAAVFGGGLAGLSAAYDLVLAGSTVDVYEQASTFGGLAGGFKDPSWDWYLENYYHHIFTSDHHIRDLVAELDLTHQLVFKHPITVSPYNNRYYPLDSPLAIFKFPGLNLPEKIRLGLTTAYLKFLASWKPLESITAEKWLTQYYGASVYRQIWEPLLTGKFGTYSNQVNMAWMWARLKSRTPSLGTFNGGFQSFINQFCSFLKDKGVNLYSSSPVESIEIKSHSKLKLNVHHSTTLYDRVLVTSSPSVMAKLAPFLPPEYLHSLLTLNHLGAINLVFALKNPLSPQGYYWHNLPKSPALPFLALVEHTNFIPASHYGGDHLVYCGDYAPVTDRRFRAPKAELTKQCLSVLASINSSFKPSWVRKVWVNRTLYAQPIPRLHHSSLIPSINTPIPSLYFASMSQVYPFDRGTNYAVEIGRRAARLMLESLPRKQAG